MLEGVRQIPVTLFEATEAVDAGEIYAQEYIELEGHELWPQIKHKQGLATQKLILDFIATYPNVKGREQEGEETFYPKRGLADSSLDIEKSIKDQFNLLRVSDNERYPAHFTINNHRYIIKIYRDDREV